MHPVLLVFIIIYIIFPHAVNNTFQIVLMEDDNATVVGARNIFDFEGVGMAHFLQMTPVTMKKMVAMGQVIFLLFSTYVL